MTVARVRESGKDPGQKATESSQISEIIEEVINLVEGKSPLDRDFDNVAGRTPAIDALMPS